MTNHQMNDTDNHCLRVQMEKGGGKGLPGKTSEMNFRLRS